MLVFVAVGCLAAQANAYTNLAPFGTVTANQTYSSSNPLWAIDEDDVTYWVAPDHGTTADPNWLQIDLGSIKEINQIFVFWLSHDTFYAGYTNTYNFYTGTTGSDWTLRKSGTFVDESENPDEQQFLLDFGDPGLNLRYVKFEVVGGTHWSAVAEIELRTNEMAGPNALPEPATAMLLGVSFLGLFFSHRKISRSKQSIN